MPNWKYAQYGDSESIQLSASIRIGVSRGITTKGSPVYFHYNINNVKSKKEYADREECKHDALKAARFELVKALAALDAIEEDLS